jgi:hypothetical protein
MRSRQDVIVSINMLWELLGRATYVGNLKYLMLLSNRCVPWKFASGAENPVLQTLQFQLSRNSSSSYITIAVSRPVYPGIRPPHGTSDQFVFLFTEIITHLCAFSMRCPLWRKDESVIYPYKCYWAMPACHSWIKVPHFLKPYLNVSFEIGFPFCRRLRLAGLR